MSALLCWCVARKLAGALLIATCLQAVVVSFPNDSNAARRVTDDSATTQINEPVDIEVLANDPNGAELVDFTLPGHGDVSRRSNGSLRYLPSANYIGADSFAYRSSDTSGSVHTANVSIEITGKITRVEARNDTGTTDEGAALRIIVLTNDAQGPDGLPVSVSIEAEPSHGQIAIREDQSVVYSPESGWTGEDKFTYMASDGQTSDRASVTITVRDLPDSPGQTTARAPAPGSNTSLTAVDDEFLVDKNAPGNILDVASNDATPGAGTYFIAIDTTPASGTVTVDALQQVIYVPQPGFSGEDSFTYSLVTSSARSSANVLIVVQGPSDANDRGSKDK
jgi:hypothetical protein